MMLGNYATPERVAELREQLGLNDPFLVQYGRYIWNAAHGDLGLSIRGQTSVSQELLARFPSTLQLAVAAMVFAIVTGLLVGVITATAKHRVLDRTTMVVSLAGLSVPSFWLAIIMILIFGVRLKLVSVTGGEGLKNMILPTFCLGLAPAAVLARLTRSCMLEVLRDDYVRTAHAKGLVGIVVIYRHVLRNALIPVVTVIGLQFGTMLGGTVLIESVFARPGLGRFAINAINARDYPQIQGMVLFMASVYVLVNLAVDILYGFMDPRIQQGGSGAWQ
jgi:ABC-type dipeptide/oligopeptide/nickel transport system permease component